MDHQLLIYVIGALWAITAYLFKRKDDAQEKRIDDLEKRSEADIERVKKDGDADRDALEKNHQTQLALLFKKHDEDAAALNKLQVEIAQRHYVKDELDRRFESLEQTFSRGFDKLGDQIERLAQGLHRSASAGKP
jgi:hypothetical protein